MTDGKSGVEKKEEKPKLYIIVKSNSLVLLANTVNIEMTKKYIPMGGVAIDARSSMYAQAMIYKRS